MGRARGEEHSGPIDAKKGTVGQRCAPFKASVAFRGVCAASLAHTHLAFEGSFCFPREFVAKRQKKKETRLQPIANQSQAAAAAAAGELVHTTINKATTTEK